MNLIRIPKEYEHHLGGIRSLENLKIGKDDHYFWIKGISDEQMESLPFQSIPFKELFVQREHLLFPAQSELPIGKIPGILWSDIDRGLPVDMPDFNHNFFGINSKLSIRLVSSEQVNEVSVVQTSLRDLSALVPVTSGVRFRNLKWVLLNNDQALIMGVPLLPLNGKSFWVKDQSILPAGYDFEYSILSTAISKQLNPQGNHWIFWDSESKYSLIPKSDFRPLSRSSVRLAKQLNPQLE